MLAVVRVDACLPHVLRECTSILPKPVLSVRFSKPSMLFRLHRAHLVVELRLNLSEAMDDRGKIILVVFTIMSLIFKPPYLPYDCLIIFGIQSAHLPDLQTSVVL
jgi:hypothetical protein